MPTSPYFRAPIKGEIPRSAHRNLWQDHNGIFWKEPEIIGRLKSRIPSHRALREFVIHRDGYKCVRCGSPDDLVADHILSRRNGGRHHPSNMQCLCWGCNSRKANRIDRVFVQEART